MEKTRNYMLLGRYTIANSGNKILIIGDGEKVYRKYNTINELIKEIVDIKYKEIKFENVKGEDKITFIF